MAAWLGLAALAVAAYSPAQSTTPLLDARSAIREIRANDPEAKIENAEEAFGDHLKSFAARLQTQPPKRAAAEWLALVDEATALPHRSLLGGMGGAMPRPVGALYNTLIDLPGPAAWPEIAALAAKRPPSADRTALLMLCARLTGDDEQVLQLCHEYEREAPPPNVNIHVPSTTNSVRFAALRRRGRLTDPAVISSALADSELRQEGFASLTDLMPVAAAKALILHFLGAHPGWPFRNRQNRKLAEQVVLEHLSEFDDPPWLLAEDDDDLPYVQALVARFGFASMFDGSNQGAIAAQICLHDFALRGDVDGAVKLVEAGARRLPSIDPEDWGAAKAVDKFVLAVQARVPQADLSDLYVSATIASGHPEDGIRRVRSLILDKATPEPQRLRLLDALFNLDKRTGDLKALAADWDLAESLRKPGDYDPAYELSGVAVASGDPALIARMIALAVASPQPWPGQPLFTALLAQGRLGQLESLVLAAVEASDAQSHGPTDPPLALCEIYYRANRPQDVLAVLKKFPYRPADDLAKTFRGIGPGFGSAEDTEENEPPVGFGFYAAWAMSKTGQTALAVRALRDVLLESPSESPCYSLLNEICGEAGLRVYDDLSRAYPFNPHPALWRAELLFRLGRTAGAEAALRQAKTIDPVGSFAYREALLTLERQILEKRGDSAGAKACGDRVAAVRVGAQASEFLGAGLLPAGRRALEQAVALWPEDAALQAQLADCLVRQCLPDEAVAHYRRAYAGLPACLGETSNVPRPMEGMFRGPQLEALGREVLDAVVKSTPADPVAWYARGLLNDGFGHSGAAAADFERCVALDPNHLAAWQSLSPLARAGLLSAEEAQRIEFRVIDLNLPSPFERPTLDLADVRNLGVAYRAIEATLQSLPAGDEVPLFPLPYSEVGSVTRRQLGGLDRFDPRARLAGRYFQLAYDIGEIANLYHRTGFPFE